MGGDVELAHRFAARRVDRGERVAGRDPDMGAVVADAADASRRRETGRIRGRSSLSFVSWCSFRGAVVASSQTHPSRRGAAGSNKVVGKPGAGGAVQRRARPRPIACALPSARQRLERALRGARAGAERQRQRRARPGFAVGQQRQHVGMRVVARRRERDDLAAAARLRARNRRSVASIPATAASALRRRPISTRSRARCDSSACRARNARAAARRASRRRATLRPARGTARTAPGASRAKSSCRRSARRGGRRRRPAPSTPAAPRLRRAAAAARRRARSAAPRGRRGRGPGFRLRRAAPGRRPAARRVRPAPAPPPPP